MSDSLQRIKNLCAGDAEAVDFLLAWAHFAHAVDDVIDGDRAESEDILAAFARCIVLTSHPFYLKNLAALRAVLLVVTNMYADSVHCGNANEKWKQDFADCYRHAGNEMLMAVAQICGGYEHARNFSMEQRAICRVTQHPEDGPDSRIL